MSLTAEHLAFIELNANTNDYPFIKVGVPLPGVPNLPNPRFSSDEQKANPNKPMTRLVKDVLRTGRWLVSTDEKGQDIYWTVTHDTLRQLAESYELGKATGVVANLVNGRTGHGDPETGIVDILKDGLAPIEELFVDGDHLWSVSYVTPDQAIQLTNPVNRVSARVVPNWRDGTGREFPLMLRHVAVVDDPVIDSQGPFLDLAKTLDLFKERKAMPVDFERTKEAVAKLLPEGITMPEDVTPDNFNDVLDIVISTIDQMMNPGKGQDETTNEGGSGDTSDALEAVGAAVDSGQVLSKDGKPSADLAKAIGAVVTEAIKPVVAQVTDLAKKVDTDKTNQKKDAYDTVLMDMCKEGTINTATRELWKAKGPDLNYDVEIVKQTLGGLKQVDMSRQGRRHASSDAPSMGDNGRRTDEEVRASLKERGIDPDKYMPRFQPVS